MAAVFPFGRGDLGGFRLLDDLDRLELLAPEQLRAEAAAAGLRAHRATEAERGARLLDHARLLRTFGERTGAPESLARAARQAEAAGPGAEASLERGLAALAAAELAGDGALLDAAAARLSETPPGDTRLSAARAALAVRQALEADDSRAAMDAAPRCDAAADMLARRSRGRMTAELAAVRHARAELLTGFGRRLRDADSAERAASDLRDLAARLDGDQTPIRLARTRRLLAEALTAAGELTGCSGRLTEAATVLSDALAALPCGHAPLERAKLNRALGHAAGALAATCEEPASADAFARAAGEAFGAAKAALEGAGAPRLSAQIDFERAQALTARALHPRALDASALRIDAERALIAELRRSDPRREPAAWAAVQVALARLYAAEPGAPRRAEAVLALGAALEVFGEQGLRSLSAEAADVLRWLRA